MKGFRSISFFLILVSFFGMSARADIALTEGGKSSGYTIKVIHDGATVGFQLFSGDQYVKNLGDKNRYGLADLERYRASLPEQISYDHGRHIAFKAGGTIVGIAAGVLVTRMIANSVEPQGGGGYLRGLAGGIAALAAIGPATIIGGIGGYFGGKALDHYFFISAERNELRAVLLSDVMLRNDRVVLDVENALEAAAELDSALSAL
jgi:hypothetical protein